MSAAVDAEPEARSFEPQIVASTGVEFSPTLGEIAKALIRAQGSMDEIFKDSTNPHFRSKYASLPACINAVKPALLANGIALIQPSTSSEDASVVFVTTMFLHESGEWIRCRLGLQPAKDDPQGAGSAITYGRRYTLLGMCGVAPDEDDDANAASPAPRASQPQQRTKPAPAPASPPAATERPGNGKLTPPAAAVDPKRDANTPGSVSEDSLGKLMRAYALLSLTGPQIAARLKKLTDGRVSGADDTHLLSENEARRFGRELKAELDARPVCEFCTAPAGEHYDLGENEPCVNDVSPRAIAFRAGDILQGRDPALFEVPM